MFNWIDNIYCLEGFFYLYYFGFVGRVDCIVEFDGELVVIDFKILIKEKSEEYIEYYFV